MAHHITIVILAAGMGVRMRSALPKVLHPVGGAPMLTHSLNAALSVTTPERISVVVRPGMEARVQPLLPHGTKIAVQEKQLGTADAVKAAVLTPDFPTEGAVLIMYADTPLLRPETLRALCEGVLSGRCAARVAGFRPNDPTGYGRLITDETSESAGVCPLLRIVEHKDANEQERLVRLCNSGVMALSAACLGERLAKIDNNNAKQEYYLTDVIGLIRAEGEQADCLTADADEFLGVNSREELAAAEAAFQARERKRHMRAGVTLIDPASVFFSHDTVLGEDVTVEPFVTFGPRVRVQAGARILSHTRLEGADIGADCSVGPFARMRPGTVLEAGAKIGNFVETKAARIRKGAKAGHLAYLGDVDVGENANIGAGTICCNYDGERKHRTEIGAGAFIGSNCALVAPVSIGTNAVTAAGSAITRNVPDEGLAFGRARQITKPIKRASSPKDGLPGTDA